MFDLKEQIFEIIKSTSKSPEDRSRWLGVEVAELGLKHNGLDDVPLDSILILAILFVNNTLNDYQILKLTEVDPSKLGDYITALSEYSLVSECQTSGNYQLTDKGKSSCCDIFKNIVIRKRFELKRSLENIEHLYSKLSEI
ncbi:hypothetical protein NYW84_12655 [Acinetobacter junii]|uniref:hypothetical protein n=1 Tax=Acinetobacter junii TaxID=40215 RepID=UPI0010AAB82E|nr:hypothetical protein [Acinetobacter junii]MCU4407813.1 hypothetical protein [Acinetobacter junii]MEB8381864.1 hypothetical protein [Acinetobacter junii]TID70733.1 hypothetical protein DIZ45_01550 [Acinetobacter junii]